MATKVQSKPYFPGSMMDLNSGFPSGMWDLYHDDITSGSEKSHFYDSFLMRQTMDGYPGYAKEQMRQTILKQESIFRHQLEELHRVYKRQRDLMNELTMKEHYKFSMPAEASKSSHFLSQVPSQITKDVHSPISNFRQVDSPFGRVSISESNSIFSPHNPLKGKCTLNGNVHNLSTERAYNLADLNEPIQAEEPSFAESLNNKNSLTEKLQNQDSSANSSSGFWFSSKISQQDLKEREGQVANGDHMVGERHKKEQLSYSFVDGKTNATTMVLVMGSLHNRISCCKLSQRNHVSISCFPYLIEVRWSLRETTQSLVLNSAKQATRHLLILHNLLHGIRTLQHLTLTIGLAPLKHQGIFQRILQAISEPTIAAQDL